MATCPKCNAKVGMESWLRSKCHHLDCPECGAHLKPSRLVSIISFVVGPGLALCVGVPLIKAGHFLPGIAILIIAPACGLWLLNSWNCFTVVE